MAWMLTIKQKNAVELMLQTANRDAHNTWVQGARKNVFSGGCRLPYISKTMKAELNIDTQELVREITSGVIKAVMPLLNHKTEANSFFTVKTLAQHLEVSEKWVYERVQFKEIPFYKLNGNVRFSKKDITIWMEAHKTPAINTLSRPLKAVKMI